MEPEELLKLAQPIVLLQAAYQGFRNEAQEAKAKLDDQGPDLSLHMKYVRACAEDAAQVMETIGVIENGLNRGKFTDEVIQSILDEK